MKIVSVWTAEQRDGKSHALVVAMSATHTAVIKSAHTPGSTRELSAFASGSSASRQEGDSSTLHGRW